MVKRVFGRPGLLTYVFQSCRRIHHGFYREMSSRSRSSKPINKSTEADGKQKSLLSYFSKLPSSGLKNDEKQSDRNVNGKEENRDICDSMEDRVGIIHPLQKRIKLTPDSRVEMDSIHRGRLLEKAKGLSLLDENMGLTWFLALEKEFDQDYFKALNAFVTSARNRAQVFPPAPNVWEWTRHCAIRDVKVVILGQDPYHGPHQAHGLCFSVKNVAPPPSLVNMYKELKDDIPNFEIPNHGCLTGWASQGVLLLNAVLTVEAHQPNSHKDKGWEKLTDATISWISNNLHSVVFLLWGAYAQKKAAKVDKRKHHLLQAVHPSPLSAHKGFFGCRHFSKCNALIEKAGRRPIDWNYLPKL